MRTFLRGSLAICLLVCGALAAPTAHAQPQTGNTPTQPGTVTPPPNTGNGTASTPVTPTTPAATNAPTITPFVPQLSVPIPGVHFTTPTLVNGNVQVPFLAQYLTGIYRYVLAISTILGIIAVIVGGFYYMLGETVGDKKRGQTIIQDALIGLLGLYAATFVLAFINPNLTSLRPLSLSSVVGIAYDVEPLGATFNASESMGAPSNANARYTGECPLTDLPADPRARRESFNQRIVQFLRATGTLARGAEVANYAANCRIFYGSCKGHARGYRALASGVTDPQASVPEVTKIHDTELIRAVRGISCYDGEGGRAPGCTTDGRTAREQVRQRLGATEQTRRADMLEPGNWAWVYNGNSKDGIGAHSITFMGWEGTNGRAHIVHGWDQANPSHHDTICLKPTCGADWQPLLWIR